MRSKATAHHTVQATKEFLAWLQSRPGYGRGRVARPFGFALTDPGRRLSRTRLFPEVTRIGPRLVSRGG